MDAAFENSSTLSTFRYSIPKSDLLVLDPSVYSLQLATIKRVYRSTVSNIDQIEAANGTLVTGWRFEGMKNSKRRLVSQNAG